MSRSGIASRFFVNGVPQWPVAAVACATIVTGVGGAIALGGGGPEATAPTNPAHRAAPQAAAPAPAVAPGDAAAAPGSVLPAVTAAHTVSAPSPVRPAPVHKVGVPATHVNYLTSDDGSLNAGVGIYSDCSGRLPLATESAAISTCISGRLYFLGHNLGVFTPLMHMGVGAGITYWDGYAVPHHFRVVNVRNDWVAANGVPPVSQPGIAAQFQTCVIPDGSVDRILDAVEDSRPAAPPAAPTATAPAATVAPPAPTPDASPVSPVTGVLQPTTSAATTSLLSNPLLGLLGRR